MTSLARFRVVSLLEGVSYIVLMGIAMPLKYLADHPGAVRIAGAIHGALFILFVLALLHAARACSWSRRQMTTAMIAALVPLGAFWLEHRLRRGSASISVVPPPS